MDALGSQVPIDPAIRLEPVVANGVAAEWATAPGIDPARVLLYIHGGGYSYGSILSHRSLASTAGRAAGCRVLTLDYRRAPEHPFPAAVEDVIGAYRFLLDQGLDPKRIAIGGDSAGGGLVMALLIAACDESLPLPACAWCISPWVDLACTGATMLTKAAADPLIQRPFLLEIAAAYLAGSDARAPLASPLYADLRGLPPLLIQVGSAETLLDDSVMLAGVAGAADVRVSLEIWPEMIHGWPLFHPHLAAGRRAIERAGAFIRAELG
jgi:acetyl esterase/lipase